MLILSMLRDMSLMTTKTAITYNLQQKTYTSQALSSLFYIFILYPILSSFHPTNTLKTDPWSWQVDSCPQISTVGPYGPYSDTVKWIYYET
jgi:hypothetical protein